MKLSTDYRPVPFGVQFKSVQHFRQVHKLLLGLDRKDTRATVAIEGGRGDAVVVQAVAVRALFWDGELERSPGGKILALFDDGCQFEVWVNGTRRAQDVYRTLAAIVNHPPTQAMLGVLQDEDRPAIIRHYAPLRELALFR